MENSKKEYKCIVRYPTRELQLYPTDSCNQTVEYIPKYEYNQKQEYITRRVYPTVKPKKSMALQLLEEIEYMQLCDEINDKLTLSENMDL